MSSPKYKSCGPRVTWCRMVHSLSQLKDYMVEKNRKLKEQFAAAARAGSTGTERHRVESDMSRSPRGSTCMNHGFAEFTPSDMNTNIQHGLRTSKKNLVHGS